MPTNMSEQLSFIRKSPAKSAVSRETFDPAYWQERHSPTEPVEIVINSSARKTTEMGRRRALDARLWNAMSASQAEAAQRIAQGFERLTAGVGVRRSAVERQANGPRMATWERAWWVIEDYLIWAGKAPIRGVSVAAALDVLADGKPCSVVDAQRRHRKGWARGNLFAGLDLYCALKGW